jgi:hypothetical protein
MSLGRGTVFLCISIVLEPFFFFFFFWQILEEAIKQRKFQGQYLLVDARQPQHDTS